MNFSQLNYFTVKVNHNKKFYKQDKLSINYILTPNIEQISENLANFTDQVTSGRASLVFDVSSSRAISCEKRSGP